MIDYIIMLGILALLLFLPLFNAKYIHDGNDCFFDQTNSKALRGFWCIIVILVHIPLQYQNAIQDIIGSFAFVGVTFFFMTSAFGLSRSASKNPDSIRLFWPSKLPKLIIPNLTINAVFILISCIFFTGKINVGRLFAINEWVCWLLICYGAFWIGHCCKSWRKYQNAIICILVSLTSILFYCLHKAEIYQTTIWSCESFGFIWGIFLFAKYDKIKAFLLSKWKLKLFVCTLFSLGLGMLYLKFKSIFFWGDYVLKILLGLSLLCLLLMLNAKIKIGNRISLFLGEISFEVYLIHSFSFKIVAKLFPNIRSGYFILASISVTVLLAMIMHKLLSMFLRKLSVLGNRRVLK